MNFKPVKTVLPDRVREVRDLPVFLSSLRKSETIVQIAKPKIHLAKKISSTVTDFMR